MDPAVETSMLERLLRRDRAVTLTALLAASLSAWAYILSGLGMEMHAAPASAMGMPMAPGWTVPHFALMLAMWAAMMMAMMLPSAAPMILLFATIERRRRTTAPFAATALFLAAYVVVWMGFSVTATLLQWQLDRLALLSPAIAGTNALLAAAVSIAVGVYQFTPLKRTCLRHCRSPLEFITHDWNRGPFGIGLRHGIFCLGCCWMLMLLLFVGGVMNLVRVAAVAVFILAEKTLRRGEWLSYGAGAAMIGWGVWMLYARAVA